MAALLGIRIGALARALTAALLLGTVIMSFSPGHTAYAVPRAPYDGGGEVDNGDGGMDTGGTAEAEVVYASRRMPELIAAGYTCTTVATGFKECTKPGSTTYWCDASGACEPKPFRNTSDEVVVPSGGVLTTTP